MKGLNPLIILSVIKEVIDTAKQVERVADIIDNEKCLVKIAEQNGAPREFDVVSTMNTINTDKKITFHVTEETIEGLRDNKSIGKLNLAEDIVLDRIADYTAFPATEIKPLINWVVKLIFPK